MDEYGGLTFNQYLLCMVESGCLSPDRFLSLSRPLPVSLHCPIQLKAKKILKKKKVSWSLMSVSLSPQMLQDCTKARREVELHWRASPCSHIVRIVDVYENLYQGKKCLLIVMEW